MLRGIGTLILVFLPVLGGCALFGRGGSGLSVEILLQRAETVEVGDAEGYREARYSFGTVREELRRVCLLWPLERNRVNSSFGQRWGRNHHGVDLRARSGTKVLAALPGRVIYAGDEIGGYGYLVLLKHARGLSTVYAHNSELLVAAGERVAQGQVIALSGETGRVSGPHLHFEIRDGLDAINPVQLLLGSVRDPSEAQRYCAEAPAPSSPPQGL